MLMISPKYWNTQTQSVEYRAEKQRCSCERYVEITEGPTSTARPTEPAE